MITCIIYYNGIKFTFHYLYFNTDVHRTTYEAKCLMMPNDETARRHSVNAGKTGDMRKVMTFLLDKVPTQIPYRSASLNHFNPEFSIVIFIHYKPRNAAAILDS